MKDECLIGLHSERDVMKPSHLSFCGGGGVAALSAKAIFGDPEIPTSEFQIGTTDYGWG